MKIVYKGKTLKGIDVVIRYPKLEDLNDLHRFVNEISKEKTFVVLQGEEITLEEEKEFLKQQIENVEKRKGVYLIAFCENDVIGVTEITLKTKVVRHLGSYGIMIAKKFRGQGLGKLLTEIGIEEAKKNLTGLEIIILDVFANNLKAIQMYEKFGFKEFGTLPKGTKLENEYVDDVLMYKNVSSFKKRS